MSRHIDTELRWMARAFWLVPALMAALTLPDFGSDIWANLFPVPIGLALQVILPAHTVKQLSPTHLVLRNNLRRIHVTPQTLRTIKGIHEGRWSAHVSVRTRHRIYIELRVWKFDERRIIAQSLLAIAEEGGSYVQPSARRILSQSISEG